MSYDKNLFHRMVEELDRMAEEEVELNSDDLSIAIMAIAHMAATMDADHLTASALEVAACNEGDMTDVFEYLPDVLNEHVELIMNKQGFKWTSGDEYEVWVRAY